MTETFDGQGFRHVLGHYPTGVCLVTAIERGDGAAGAPVGMVIGSFTSASLDPPLVAFFPDRRSRTWPRIEAAGKFCANVLASDQEAMCRGFAAATGDKFAGLSHRVSDNGSPIIEGALAWIDCDLHAVHDAGDHFIVLGAVRALRVERRTSPLLFFQGGYGAFSTRADTDLAV